MGVCSHFSALRETSDCSNTVLQLGDVLLRHEELRLDFRFALRGCTVLPVPRKCQAVYELQVIWSSEGCLFSCIAVWTCKKTEVATFRRDSLEDGDSIFLQNVCICQPSPHGVITQWPTATTINKIVDDNLQGCDAVYYTVRTCGWHQCFCGTHRLHLQSWRLRWYIRPKCL
jgi:hypothetical protein